MLLVGEVLREASRAAAGTQLQLLVQSMALMLSDKLQGLCKFYEESAEQEAIHAIAASLNPMNKRPKSVGTGGVAQAMNLWQADEVLFTDLIFSTEQHTVEGWSCTNC